VPFNIELCEPLSACVRKKSDYIAVERFSRFKRGDWEEERGQVIYGLVIGNEGKLTWNTETSVQYKPYEMNNKL